MSLLNPVGSPLAGEPGFGWEGFYTPTAKVASTSSGCKTPPTTDTSADKRRPCRFNYA